MSNILEQYREITTSCEVINPQQARAYLSTSLGNRRIRENKVREYAQSMLLGRWLPCNDDICFDGEGHLINGHTRLTAVILANIPVAFSVKRGVPREAFKYMDTGAIRRAGDMLDIAKRDHVTTRAAVALMVLRADPPRGFATRQFSKAEVFDEAEREEKYGLFRYFSGSLLRHFRAAASCFYYFAVKNGNDPEIVANFIHAAEKPVGQAADSPILALSQKLISLSAASPRTDTRNTIVFGCFVRAFAALQNGEKLKLIRLGANLFPEGWK